MNKIVSGADEAIHDINNGATIMLGDLDFAVFRKIALVL
jgi:acyl CoA:acetate/3-ketoacid CoA transferase alpha subunit